MMNDTPKIHISYGGEDSTNYLVSEIKSRLHAFDVVDYQNKSSSGEKYSIEALINEIGTSGYIIAVISEKYLTDSRYCQREIRKLVQNDIIEERVFPIYVKDIPDLIYDEGTKNELIEKAQDFINTSAKKISDSKRKRQFKECYTTIETFINKLDDTDGWVFKHNEIDKLIKKLVSKIDGKKIKNLYASIPIIDQNYVNRPEQIEEISEIILDKSTRNIGIWGMGGIGKTSFSVEIANNTKIREYFADGIYFISLGQNPNTSEIIGKLLEYLDEDSESPSFEKLQKVFEHLNALLIIDNVWDIRDLSKFKINALNTKVLITTRRRNIIQSFNAKEYKLFLMSEKESIRILEKKVGYIKDEFKYLAIELLKRSGYLPLAIDIMGSMIFVRGANDIEVWKNILNRLSNDKLDKIKFEKDNEEHKNLFKVIDLSVEYLDSEIRERYLEFKVFNHFRFISKATLKAYFDEDEFFDVISVLESASLLTKMTNEYNYVNYVLHDLQKSYIEEMGVDSKVIYTKLLNGYIKRYEKKWYNVDINDAFFFNHYMDMCDSAGKTDLKIDIARSIIYEKENVNVNFIKIAIDILEENVNIKDISRKLLNIKNNHPTTLAWIFDVLGKKDIDVKNFAQEYLKYQTIDSNANISFQCLKILGENNSYSYTYAMVYLERKISDLHPHLFTECLRILGSDSPQSINTVNRCMSQDINNLHPQVLDACLKIWGEDSVQSQEISAKYLQMNIEKIQSPLAENCMNILGYNHELVRQFAEQYIKQYENRKPNIIKVCLEIIDKDSSVKFAKNYLNNDFKILNTALANICIRKLDNTFSKDIICYAEKYLDEYYLELNSQLIGISLIVLSNNRKAISYAKKYMHQDFDDINPFTAQYCLSILGRNNKDVILFSEKYLQQDTKKLNNYILPIVLNNIDYKNEIAVKYAKKYMCQDFDDINPLIAQYCLRILGKNNKYTVLFSEKYLQQDMKSLNNYVVPKALGVLSHKNEIAVKYAKKYMHQNCDDIHSSIAQYCLPKLERDNEDAVLYAEKYIKQNFNKMNHSIAQLCLKKLEEKNMDAISYAENYLKQKEVKLNDHYIKRCLYFLGNKNHVVYRYALNYLDTHLDMKNINTYIAKECLFSFQNKYNRIAEEFCEKYLIQEQNKVEINLKKQCHNILNIYSI